MTRIEQIKALCEAATKGPWPYKYTGDGKRIIVGEGLIDGPNGYDVAEFYSDDCPSDEAESNAQFASASRELVPELIELVEEMAGALEAGNFTYLGGEYVFCAKPDAVKAALAKYKAFNSEVV